MARRSPNFSLAVKTEGGLFPTDFLLKLSTLSKEITGLEPEQYHLSGREKINEAINRAYGRLQGFWLSFKDTVEKLSPEDYATSTTKEKWLLPLFDCLGYGRLVSAEAITIGDKQYKPSHIREHVPVHLVGFRVDLDKRSTAGGARSSSPHSLVQELLNQSDNHLWAFVSNGRKLRLLRDNVSLTRQAFVEFDLENIFEGDGYSDFRLLWLLCHQSRLDGSPPEGCWLEKWIQLAQQTGVRIREQLRTGVEEAINVLGSGFIADPANTRLREDLRNGVLSRERYYRQLLRTVYRMLFLFVAEDREALLEPSASSDAKERYRQFYSTQSIRKLAGKRRGTVHRDLWQRQKLVFRFLSYGAGCPELALAPLGSFLWSEQALPDLDNCEISNRHFLEAVKSLCYTVEGEVVRAVDYKNLRSEELGSIYESLLQLHPEVNLDAAMFKLQLGGSERKTTGSYYTPDSLVQCLLDSALDPVLEDRLKAKKGDEAEQAILDIKVCDPSCGSGHFLIAAAHRLARRLASVRTGEPEPSPADYQHALRAVIGTCIYGVDLNPMAVELCKVSLWMEAVEPGKPLSFLDHHIQCGNSLLGTTPYLLSEGIPNDAFNAIEGDVKECLSALAKVNEHERRDYKVGQGYLFSPALNLGTLPETISLINKASDESIKDVAAKQEMYETLVSGSEFLNARLLADTWCAAFVWQKDDSALGKLCPTERDLRNIQENSDSINVLVKAEVQRLSDEFQFFHWHLSFPDVFFVRPDSGTSSIKETGWSGGFDVVLGNPPWEKVQVEEQGFFATRDSEIASLPGAKRKRAIDTLSNNNPTLFFEWSKHKRAVGGLDHLLKDTGMFPLAGKGKINTYAVFVEISLLLVNRRGRSSLIVPLGLVTDHGTKDLFGHIALTGLLRSVLGFENEEFIFPDVHHAFKFCILCASGADEVSTPMEFAFFARQVADLNEAERRFSLLPSDIELLNPNTKTCPIFKYRQDFEIARQSYQKFAVIDDESKTNVWRLSIHRVFNSTDDSSDMFAVGTDAHRPPKSKYEDRTIASVYEAKMFHQFDHRFGTYVGQTEAQERQGKLPELTENDHANPKLYSQPRYWMYEELANSRLNAHLGDRQWLVAFRDITSPVVFRTAIASVLPKCPTVDYRCFFFEEHVSPREVLAFLAIFNSFMFDFLARQKFSGTHLSTFIVKQLPMPSVLEMNASGLLNVDELARRVIELTYTAWDVEACAVDCGYKGPPFRWDEERRFLLRCELDAASFHLFLGSPSDWGIGNPVIREMFPTPRDAVDYVMETFPIVKRRDIERSQLEDDKGKTKQQGRFVTKEAILEIYDDMAEAISNKRSYRSRLNPAPGPPSDASGRFMPLSEWDPQNWPRHIHDRC